MVKRWFSSLYHTIWRQNLMRSGMVTGLLLIIAVLALSIAYQQHTHGNLHKLKQKMTTERQELPVSRPGGREAIRLRRAPTGMESLPEFLSATLLPGRGMNVLQITAHVPDKGDVELLVSPTVETAETALTGKGADANGQASMAMGGAFEAPWAGRIFGTSADGHMTSQWRGHTLTLPQTENGTAVANGGLLLARSATSADNTPLPDGGQAQATFDAEDFGAHWPSKTQVTITVLLSGKTIELTMVAKNTGDVAEPIALGWQPRFAIDKQKRGEVRLRIPGEMRVEVRDRKKGLPTGTLIPVKGTSYDFTATEGTKLGSMDLDDCFVKLHQGLLDSGPVAEMTDPARGYGIRLTSLSSAIKALHVLAPADGDYVSIEPQFNYPDPFGREWVKTPDNGLVLLAPGQSTQWQVRLELISSEDYASRL
jgi:galactose mutarotase-like enzyme